MVSRSVVLKAVSGHQCHCHLVYLAVTLLGFLELISQSIYEAISPVTRVSNDAQPSVSLPASAPATAAETAAADDSDGAAAGGSQRPCLRRLAVSFFFSSDAEQLTGTADWNHFSVSRPDEK